MKAAAFILSDVRSGSTLLDQCLGAHSEIVTLGESHWLAAYVRQDRSLYDPVHDLVCACGMPVVECEFWRNIQRELGRPLDSLRLHSGFTRLHRDFGIASRIRHLPRRLVRAHPSAYRLAPVRASLGGVRLGKDILRLLEAVYRATGRRICVDSSKSPFRFRAFYDVAPSMRQIDALTCDLSSNSVHTLKYESLCENPRVELARLCKFLGIEFEASMLRRPEMGHAHHIGGSPSKFDGSRAEIALDRGYEGAFSAADVDYMRSLVAREAARWSY
jgi:hypothetical protein